MYYQAYQSLIEALSLSSSQTPKSLLFHNMKQNNANSLNDFILKHYHTGFPAQEVA